MWSQGSLWIRLLLGNSCNFQGEGGEPSFNPVVWLLKWQARPASQGTCHWEPSCHPLQSCSGVFSVRNYDKQSIYCPKRFESTQDFWNMQRGKPCKEAGPCVVDGRLWGRDCGGTGWLWESPVPVLQGVCAVGVLCPRAFCRAASPFCTSVWWKDPFQLAMFSSLAANVKAHLNLCERWDQKVDKWIAPFLTGSILYHGFMQCVTFQLNSSVIF